MRLIDAVAADARCGAAADGRRTALMSDVLISIQPKWCHLILTGAKTAEVRKTIPAGVKLGKNEELFRCFIYETKGKSETPWIDEDGHMDFHGRGKVVGEFMCDGIYPVYYTMDGLADFVDCKTSCMKPRDFREYGKGKRLYRWHISDLKVYDKPKELSDFCFPEEKYCEKELCGGCPYEQRANQYGEYEYDCEWQRPLTRPPQSWCYVKKI